MIEAHVELMEIIKVVMEKARPLQNEGKYVEPILIFNMRYYDDLRQRLVQEMNGLKMGVPMKLDSVYGYPVLFDPNIKTYKVVFDIK